MTNPTTQYTDNNSVMAPGSFGAPAPAFNGAPFANGPCRAIWVGTGGTVVGRSRDDTQDLTFRNVPSGSFLDYRFNRLMAGTTAADIVLIY